MIPGINPSQMQGMMRKMGISQEEIDASKVIIEKNDGTRTIIQNPDVMKIKMQGNISYQISGEEFEEDSISEEDVQTIIEKTGCTAEEARDALEKTGDLAEAILELS
jgi:alpha-NAC-related protein